MSQETPEQEQRLVDRGPAGGCPVELDPDGTWRVRSQAAGRALLRSTDTVQAGLGVETVEKLPTKVRRPVLYRDGPEHREHRRQTARFFTPRRVDEHYRDVIVDMTERQLDVLRRDGVADLGELSFGVAIGVAAAVIGLTESRPGMRRRLERFFPETYGTPGFTSPSGIYWAVRSNVSWLAIYLGDVRPAVKVRRRQRRDDLVSHLIDEGCSDAEILGECLTFAAAGMVTTREFIVVAAWHLFNDPELRARFVAGDEEERTEILQRLVRLEPVVGNLKRRTTAPVTLPGPDGPVDVPAGALVDVDVSAANLDGDEAAPAGLAFGDGAHKCPGSHVALRETDVFLTRLLALPSVRMVSPPRVSFKPEISGYELRGLTVAIG